MSEHCFQLWPAALRVRAARTLGGISPDSSRVGLPVWRASDVIR
ncbi:hypothetical protein [Synechococcus sp. A18-25c]|nr:hypothetical protein [Synechococcus sp. A18-25c]